MWLATGVEDVALMGDVTWMKDVALREYVAWTRDIGLVGDVVLKGDALIVKGGEEQNELPWTREKYQQKFAGMHRVREEWPDPLKETIGKLG
ncbi:hypothetical protein E3N88_09899 [Mikania micrantha]|uniref:Uncharacterized protein n=1 Tax=Mikania micrantha TaxID=192012 RepID=A0A5N6PA73_9ASTR|nr:hypothetical protein E3N88_09899 [Mikania micrantha]